MKYEYIQTEERNKEVKAIKRKNIFQRSVYILSAPVQVAAFTVTMPYNMVKAGIQAKKDEEKVIPVLAKEFVRPLVETLEDIVGVYHFGTSNLEEAKAKFVAEDEVEREKQEEQKKAEAAKRAKENEAHAKARGMDKIAAVISNAERIEEGHGYYEYYNIHFKDCILELGRGEAVIYDKSEKVLNKLPMDEVCYRYLEGFIKARKNELQKEERAKKMDSFINTLNGKSR